MRNPLTAASAAFVVAVLAQPAAVKAQSAAPQSPAPEIRSGADVFNSEVTCQTRAGWGDPYPSIIILKRLMPECDVAEVRVVRTNGHTYRAQCARYRDGRLTIATATGDYSLRVDQKALIGDFVSTVNPDFSRPGLIWNCNRSTATATEGLARDAANGMQGQ